MKLSERIRAACRTNEPQRNAVVLFSAVCCIAILKNGSYPWWAYLIPPLCMVSFAFLLNFHDPIPQENK